MNEKDEYSSYTLRKIIFIAVSIVLVFALFWVSLCVGTLDLSVSEVYAIFWDHVNGVTYELYTTEWYNDHFVWEYRVPRAIFAIVAGIALAIGGCAMQSVMKNPLADPYTTGVSSGAMFGVAIAIVLGYTVGTDGTDGFGVILNAVIFSLIPVAIMVVMAPFFKNSPASLILTGVAVSYLFNSLTTFLLVTTDAETLQFVYTWQVGSLDEVGWDALSLPILTTVIGLAILLPLANKLNLMSLSDKEARSLGLDVEKLRIICLIIIAVMASAVISYVGIIGFVGLVIPHILRMLLGADNKYIMPAAAAFGAFFLLGCDIICRAVDVSVIIPVGVVTSFVGAPIFLFLIIKQRGSMW